jgi:ribosomal protein S18 acetylase RimI-like enzyme
MTRVEYHRDATDYRAEVRDLLALTDAEFHPPLSVRDGPTQTADLDGARDSSIEAYVDSMIGQQFLLVLDGATLAGVQSFRTGYDADALGVHTPATYASTLVVHPDYRRAGHARRLYRRLLTDPVGAGDPYVATRTWSTNDAHLSLLDELGFECVATLEDDRGEGIDTVYYALDAAEPDA